MALNDIENALLAEPIANGAVLRGCDNVEIQYNPEQLQGSVKCTVNHTEQQLDNVDLVVVATGARSGNPFSDERTLAKDLFPMRPVANNYGGVAFLKTRFPAKRGQIPQQGERDITVHNDNGDELNHRWVNMYQGRAVLNETGEPVAYDNGMIFEMPPELAGDKTAARAYINDVLTPLQHHPDAEVAKTAQAVVNEGDSNTSEVLVAGGAGVSHWFAETSVSKDNFAVGIGDAMCPPHPWTGSGSNLAIQATTPLEGLVTRLSAIKASGASVASKVEGPIPEAFSQFDREVTPLVFQSLFRGHFASQMFDKIRAERGTLTDEAASAKAAISQRV